MSALLSFVMEAAHVGFALLARKLILCGELIAIVALVGWNLDARVGLSLWPQRVPGTSRASAVLPASATVLVVLFVAFVRDFADLGANPSFLRYGGMCLGVMAVVTSCAALWVGGRFDRLGLVGVWACTAVGVVCIHVGERLCGGLLEPIGQLFRAGPERLHHGLAAVLSSVGALALAIRLITTKGRLPSPSPWDLFLVFAVTALAQGFLAFRGVSAISILAIPAALAWRAGWRAQLALGQTSLLVKLFRSQPPIT